MYIQTDSDAGGQSSSGVGQVDQTGKALRDILPNWMIDGHGIRGPQEYRPTEKAEPSPMNFGIDQSSKAFAEAGDKGGALEVTVEDASGYAPGSGVSTLTARDVLTFDTANFEIYDGGGGQAVVKLKTCPATCPA